MLITYCKSCGKRIVRDNSRFNYSFGDLEKVYCPECLARLSASAEQSGPDWVISFDDEEKKGSRTRRLARSLLLRRLGRAGRAGRGSRRLRRPVRSTNSRRRRRARAA